MRRLTIGLLLVLMATAMPSAAAQDGASFRLAVIPDTQVYSESDEGAVVVQAMFDWVVGQAAATNTVFVTHVGDVVERGNNVAEWDRVEPGFDALEAAGLPYAIAPGNKDLGDDIGDGEPLLYDERFPASRFDDEPWFGASHEPEGNRSSWQEISVTGHELLFVHLRHLNANYGDPAEPIAWLDGVLDAHPNHLVFVTTHEFTQATLPGEEALIRIPALAEVIQDHCNVAAVFSGHLGGESARGTFDDTCGRTVHHILTNYQFVENGGNGFLRTLDIDPFTLDATSIVYSPTLDAVGVLPDEAFTIGLAKLVPAQGDPNCDRASSIVDALLVAQFVVGVRTDHGTCPLPDPLTQLDASTADVDIDDDVTIVDALLIARCAAGIAGPACPAE